MEQIYTYPKAIIDQKIQDNKLNITTFTIQIDKTKDTLDTNSIGFDADHIKYVETIQNFIIDNYNKIVNCRLIIRVSSDESHMSLNFPAYFIPKNNYSIFNIQGNSADTTFTNLFVVMLCEDRVLCNYASYSELVWSTNSKIEIIFTTTN
jgi:hypothetical protein